MIETERLRLRRLTRNDLDQMAVLLGDPEVMRYYPGPKTRLESLAWIEWNLRSYRDHGFGLWAMELKTTGEFVGDCGLSVQTVEGVSELEVGYHVVRRWWGKGFATEAAAASRDYARGQLRVDRLIAIIHPQNLASQAVARKIGLRLEREALYGGLKQLIFAASLRDGD